MRIAANKAYCLICRTALLTRKSLIPMRTSAKSVPRKKRTAATPFIFMSYLLQTDSQVRKNICIVFCFVDSLSVPDTTNEGISIEPATLCVVQRQSAPKIALINGPALWSAVSRLVDNLNLLKDNLDSVLTS